MAERTATAARLRRLTAAAVVAAAVAGLAAGTIAARFPPSTMRLEVNQVWLAAPGRVVLVDGATAEPVRSLDVPATEVRQIGSDAVLLIPDGVALARYADQDVIEKSDMIDPPRAVTVGGGRVYSANTGGWISAVDPVTLSFDRLTPTPARPSQAVDGAGRLWLLDRDTGHLSWFEGSERRGSAAARAFGVVVPGPEVVLAEPTEGRLSLPGRPGTTCTVDSALVGAELSAGDRPGTVVARSEAAGTVSVLTVPGRGGRCGSSIVRLRPGRSWGEPLLRAGRIYLPDADDGSLVVLEPGSGQMLSSTRVTAAGTAVALIERAGYVYYNDPDSEAAGVVRPDGRMVRIPKDSRVQRPSPTGTRIPGPARTPGPTTTSGATRASTTGARTSNPRTAGVTTGLPGTPPVSPRPPAGAESTGTTDVPEPEGPGPGTAGSGTTTTAADPDLLLSVQWHGGRARSQPPGIDCPGACEHRFKPGTRVRLTATTTAVGGARITGAACPGEDVCDIVLDRDTSVAAVVLGEVGRPGGPDGVAVLEAREGDGSPADNLDFAWVDSQGRVLYARADTDGSSGKPLVRAPQWSVLSGPGTFTGRPELLDGPGTGLAIAAQGTDGRIWATSRASAGSGSWRPWVRLAEGLTLLRRSLPTLDGDPCPAVLGLAGDGAVWRMTPPPAEGEPASATRVLTTSPFVWASVAVAHDGSLRLAGVDEHGGVQVAPLDCEGHLRGWDVLFGAGRAEPPTLLIHPDNTLQVFVRDADTDVLREKRQTDLGWPEGWTRAGPPTQWPADWMPTDRWPVGAATATFDVFERPLVLGVTDRRSLQFAVHQPEEGWGLTMGLETNIFGSPDAYRFHEPSVTPSMWSTHVLTATRTVGLESDWEQNADADTTDALSVTVLIPDPECITNGGEDGGLLGLCDSRAVPGFWPGAPRSQASALPPLAP